MQWKAPEIENEIQYDFIFDSLLHGCYAENDWECECIRDMRFMNTLLISLWDSPSFTAGEEDGCCSTVVSHAILFYSSEWQIPEIRDQR